MKPRLMYVGWRRDDGTVWRAASGGHDLATAGGRLLAALELRPGDGLAIVLPQGTTPDATPLGPKFFEYRNGRAEPLAVANK